MLDAVLLRKALIRAKSPGKSKRPGGSSNPGQPGPDRRCDAALRAGTGAQSKDELARRNLTARKQIVLPSECDGAQRSLGGIVVHLDAPSLPRTAEGSQPFARLLAVPKSSMQCLL